MEAHSIAQDERFLKLQSRLSQMSVMAKTNNPPADPAVVKRQVLSQTKLSPEAPKMPERPSEYMLAEAREPPASLPVETEAAPEEPRSFAEQVKPAESLLVPP